MTLLAVLVMHRRLKRVVRRQTTGLISATVVVMWRRRTLLNISLWEDVKSISSMGNVRRHVDASRIPNRLGITTVGGIFSYAGDWRHVMFDLKCRTPSPLSPLK